MTRAEEIVNYAVQLREHCGTNNPYRIAEYLGCVVNENVGSSYRAAYVIKLEGYPVIISIAKNYTYKAQKILCAHELGHVLLLKESYNSFDVTGRDKYSTAEYEANIFTLALLSRGKALHQIKKLSPYEAKMILDKRINAGKLEQF